MNMKICKLPVTMLLIFAMILTTACESNNSDDIRDVEINVAIPYLPDGVEFDGITLKFEGEGETVGIDVEIERAGWYVLLPTLDSWLTFNRHGSRVYLTATGNISGMPRVSRVDFAYGETVKRIAVEQDYLRLISFPRGDEVIVSAGQASISFAIRTNVAQENLTVSVTEPENVYWINPISVTNNAVIFGIAHNPSPIDARQATITVSGEGTSASFSVIQRPMSVADIPEE